MQSNSDEMPPKMTRLAILRELLLKLVDDLSAELERVMQIVKTTANLEVNLQKDCFLLHDMHRNCERVVSGLISHEIEIHSEEGLSDIYGDLVAAQKSYCELNKTLEAINELKSIKSLMDMAGDDLYAYKAILSLLRLLVKSKVIL